jgi:N-acetylmuramoyl-L-alanine amidase
MRALRIAAFLLLAAPPAAHAADPSISKRDVTLGGGRAPAAVHESRPFDMIGLHWRGAGRVSFRTRSLSGHWSAWRAAAPEAEDLPDVDAEQAHPGWHLGNPWWTGPADRFQIRTRDRVTKVRAWLVQSRPIRIPLRRITIAGSPPILSRKAWGANEAIRRAAPRYAPVLRMAVVHHTAGGTGSGPETSAAIVRGIELYHVKANGWNDIGYNFLVDRWGQVFEGRFGGMTNNVIGAHALGFNTGSVGVALIGTYSSTKPTPAAERSLAALLSWRLDVAHVDPASSAMIASGGNPKFIAGEGVYLHAISGHRDTGFTACPGNALYARLPGLIEAAATTGLPKLYEPSARGSIGKTIRFSARLSAPLQWSITVTGPDGATVARKQGIGDHVSWSWNSAGRKSGRYLWTIEAGSSLRPARGVIGAGAVISAPTPRSPVSGLTVSPSVVTPDGDGYADVATVMYTLAESSRVTVTLEDEYGLPAATLYVDSHQAAGTRTVHWPLESLESASDGRYRIAVTVRTDKGRRGRVATGLVIMRAIGWARADPGSFSPDGDGIGDTIAFSFTASKGAQVAVEVRQAARPVALVLSGWVDAGSHSVLWDGRVGDGVVAPGTYELWVTASDEIGTVSEVVPFSVVQRPG